MNKEIIKEKYDKLVSEIEGMKMYDGRGTVDRYICDTCGCMMHTTYKDKGVTPFTMRCRKCNGTMYHKRTFIKNTIPDWVEVKNWYRPTLEQTLHESQSTIEHILNGKEHRSVLLAIRNLLTTAQNYAVRLFAEYTYTNEQGKQQPIYIMNRDGFTLLAMGFTGTLKKMRYFLWYSNKNLYL